MSDHYYLPRGEREMEGWLFNFSTQLKTFAQDLGINPTVVSDTENDYLAYKYMLDVEDIIKAALHAQTTFKDTLFNGKKVMTINNYPVLPTLPPAPVQVGEGIIHRITSLVQVIKNCRGYDESIGQALRIIAADSHSTLDRTKLKPEVKVFENNANHVALKWVKGDMDGVIVFVNTATATAPVAGEKIDAEAAISWVEFTRCTVSPFNDTRKNASNHPETRMYKMQYMEKDKPVGLQSDIIKVVASIY